MNTFSENIFNNYNLFNEKRINQRQFKHSDLSSIVSSYKSNEFIEFIEIGKSTEGREIYLNKIGTGNTKVFLWSQMHGNETCGTQAIFDIISFFNKNILPKEIEAIIRNCSLYFLPLLNPDGAENNKRKNALDIDINRDALRLQSLEGKLLSKLIEDINPDFGFNLHDQEIYYSAGNTKNPASISFLAPAYNFEKTINETRKKSIQVILHMKNVLQYYIPNCIAKYYDDFMPTAFGDNIQKQGVSTILIESGAYYNDPEKQYIRKLNTCAILSAIYSISQKSYKNIDIEKYNNIPFNVKNKLFDYIFRNCSLVENDYSYIADIGIRKNDFEGEAKYEIVEIGDLSLNYGYVEKNLNSQFLRGKYRIGDNAENLIAHLIF